MGVHIVSVLANIHYQLTTTSGVQLQPQLDKDGREIELPDPQTAPGEYVEELISLWSAGRSHRPPIWSELLQVLQDIGQLELRQQIEAFMKGMCTVMLYSRRQYKVSVTYRLPTVPYLKKTPSKTVPFYSAGCDAILLLYAIRI